MVATNRRTSSSATLIASSEEDSAVALAGDHPHLGLPVSATRAFATSAAMVGRDEDGFGFTATNVYSERDGRPGVDYPWLEGRYLVEQHRATTLTVVNATSSSAGSDCTFPDPCASTESAAAFTYEWSIAALGEEDAEGDSAVATGTGDAFEHVFTTAGHHSVAVKEVDLVTGVSVRSHTEIVVCKYVRREIRSLTSDDREKFLAAMSEVYHLQESEGQVRYGSDYHDIYYFAELHNGLAGDAECDHLHDGLGFFTNHVALANEFERSLQTVDPAVSLPYWDFTMDADRVRLDGANFSAFFDSPIFSEDRFGDVDATSTRRRAAAAEDGDGSVNPPPPAEQSHGLASGRFGNVSVDPADWNRKSDVVNAYGLMRAPWNTNNERTLTRSHTTFGFEVNILPNCEDHAKMLEYSSWSAFGMDAQYLPHGPIHTLIGGTFGGDDWEGYLNHRGYDMVEAQKWAIRSFGAAKDMWRAGTMTCPSTCSADTPASECKCTCQNITAWIDAGESATALATYVHPRFENAARRSSRNGDDLSDDLLKLFCNDDEGLWPLVGDSLSSSSALDPTFWPMHPTMDRLLHWKRLNGFVDETWDDHTYKHADDGVCWGHRADDALLFTDPADGHHYSNTELYGLMDPRNESMPYVYDTFKWSHCEEQGVHMRPAVGA